MLHMKEGGHMPAGDVLRPGGSVGLLTGLVVDTYAWEGEHGCRRREVTMHTVLPPPIICREGTVALETSRGSYLKNICCGADRGDSLVG